MFGLKPRRWKNRVELESPFFYISFYPLHWIIEIFCFLLGDTCKEYFLYVFVFVPKNRRAHCMWFNDAKTLGFFYFVFFSLFHWSVCVNGEWCLCFLYTICSTIKGTRNQTKNDQFLTKEYQQKADGLIKMCLAGCFFFFSDEIQSKMEYQRHIPNRIEMLQLFSLDFIALFAVGFK